MWTKPSTRRLGYYAYYSNKKLRSLIHWGGSIGKPGQTQMMKSRRVQRRSRSHTTAGTYRVHSCGRPLAVQSSHRMKIARPEVELGTGRNLRASRKINRF